MFHQESGVRFRPCFLQKEVVLLCGLQGPGKTAGAAEPYRQVWHPRVHGLSEGANLSVPPLQWTNLSPREVVWLLRGSGVSVSLPTAGTASEGD